MQNLDKSEIFGLASLDRNRNYMFQYFNLSISFKEDYNLRSINLKY